jgi:hypothetical protein
MMLLRIVGLVVLLVGCAELRQFWDKEFVEVYTPGASQEQKIRETGGILNYWLGRPRDERIRVMGPPDRCTALQTGEDVCEWTTRGASSGQQVTYTYDRGVATAWSYRGTLGVFSSDNFQTGKASVSASQASSSSSEWVHPTKPKSDFTQEFTNCQNDIVKNPKSVYADRFVLQDLTFACMKQRGWRQGR